MGLYVVRRLSLFLPTLLLITIILFVMIRVVPGDPALLTLLGDLGHGHVDAAELEAMRHKLGTDRPIVVQYYTWLWDMVRGDFGDSMWYGDPVWSELKQKFPTTLELTILAFVIGFTLAVPLGILSAVKQDSWIDYIARAFSFTGIAIPTFWAGILTIFILVRVFDWLPQIGFVPFWEDPLTNIQQMIWPAAVLGFYNVAIVARITRSAMLDVLREDYIRTARAKGLHEVVVLFRHALKNAILPVLTVSGWQVGHLISGAVITEAIFLVPGIGITLVEATFHRDYTMIQGVVFTVSLGILTLNLAIDLLYAWIDPRIRYT